MLSRDEAYSVRESVTVAPLTTRKRGLPVEVLLTSQEGVPKECVINVDSMATIEKASLKGRVCALSVQKMDEVHRAIKFALALP
jgi:mRNA interferase MazF